jgi:protein TonB
MVGPLLYQPRSSWRTGIAFAAAALIHFGAVALASKGQHEQIKELPSLPPGTPEVEIEPATRIDDSTPPPAVDTPSPMPNPANEWFEPERSTPALIRRENNRLVAPMVKVTNGTPGSLTSSSAKILALNAPRPEYPYEARRQKITGDGVVIMSVDPGTGSVIAVSIWKSTGSTVLDNAAVAAFRRWRFKPGTVSRVKSPITFTMTGAQS